MPSVLGHIIVIALLLVIVFFCGRSVVRDIRGALKGNGCGGCTGNCASCGSSCASCAASKEGAIMECGGKNHAYSEEHTTG